MTASDTSQPGAQASFAVPAEDRVHQAAAAVVTLSNGAGTEPLLAFAAARSREAGGAGEEELRSAAEAVARTLGSLPEEAGLAESPAAAELDAMDCELASWAPRLPEAEACRLWIATVAGQNGATHVNRLAELASRPLWEPVLALVLRGLAACGARSQLADLVQGLGRGTATRLEVGLEALLPVTGEMAPAPEAAAAADVAGAWKTLLDAELRLAGGEDPLLVEAAITLVSAAPRKVTGPPPPDDERDDRRLAARVLAARARAQIGSGRDPSGLFDQPAAALLPLWEIHYLRGIGAWRTGQLPSAERELEAASRANPDQSCVALALAALLGRRDSDGSLALLEAVPQSREVLVARAVLCVRRGDYDAAETWLTEASAKGGEPARHLWAAGRRVWRERETHLRAALAERRGDARVADQSPAGPKSNDQPLQTARRVFVAARAVAGAAATDRFQRGALERKVKSGLGALGTGPLFGDALFFRAASALALAPDQAVKDFRVLLARRTWIDRERRSDSRRLLFVGDALLRLGYPDDALRAYRSVATADPPGREIGERWAVALVARAMTGGTDQAGIVAAFAEADRLAPTSPWPAVLAAFGLIAAGDPERAASLAAEAAHRGCPPAKSAALVSLGESARHGQRFPEADADALGLPDAARSILAFIGGDSSVDPAPLLQATDAERTPELVRRGLRVLCGQARWAEAQVHAVRLATIDQPWAQELVALVKVRHALQLAKDGDLDAADRELATVGDGMGPAPTPRAKGR